MSQTDAEQQALWKRLDDAGRIAKSDVKAHAYINEFFDRQRWGRKIIARVEGNHGTYTVSIDGTGEVKKAGCSCYIGRSGGCHHCRALAETFLADPASFVPQEIVRREEIRSLEDLQKWQKGALLSELVEDLKAHGITQKRLGEVMGMTSQLIGAAKRSEQRQRDYGFLGALKLACLYLLEHPEWVRAEGRKNPSSQRKKRKNTS